MLKQKHSHSPSAGSQIAMINQAVNAVWMYTLYETLKQHVLPSESELKLLNLMQVAAYPSYLTAKSHTD